MSGKLHPLSTPISLLLSFFVLFIIGFSRIENNVSTNSLYVRLGRLLVDSTIEQQERVLLLEQIWQESCRLYFWVECKTTPNQDFEQRLMLMYDRLVDSSTPLVVVSNSHKQTLDLTHALIRATSSIQDNQVVLWGNGYMETRLFSFLPVPRKVAVLAMHHSPPPVVLQVELNSSQIATLGYSRGDQTWETQVTDPLLLSSGINILRVWYLNDLLNKSLGQDRNAYIRSVVIESP